MPLKLKVISFSILALAFAVPSYSAVKADIDTDKDGAISVEEFVLFSGERDMKQRDANKDGVFSTQEWLGKGASSFRKAALTRFDSDGDGVLTTSEAVDVYLWTFSNRDKNGDNLLTENEIPKVMIQNDMTGQSTASNSSKTRKSKNSYTKDVVLEKAVIPAMPKKANESGYCCMAFDVTEKGRVTNVSSNFCSNEVFRKPSELSLTFWRFKPAKLEGNSVDRYDVKRNVVFNLIDETGRLIPSSNGYLTPLDSAATIPVAPDDPEVLRAWLKKYYSTRKTCL